MPFFSFSKKHKVSGEINSRSESGKIQSTWDDYAIMSMVESGLGISILPQLILQRIPYRIVDKELDVPAYRNIVIALRDKKSASLAVKRFLEYIPTLI